MKRDKATPRREELERLLPAPEVAALTEDRARVLEEFVMRETTETTDGAGAEPATARLRGRRALWVAIPVAAALVGGAVTAGSLAGNGGSEAPAQAAPASPAQLLDRVATTAGERGTPVPDADQYIYSRVLRTVFEWEEERAPLAMPEQPDPGGLPSTPEVHAEVVVPTGPTAVGTAEVEIWMSPDGTRGWSHHLEGGVPGEGQSLDSEPWEPYLESPTYDFLTTLPTDADGLLDRVYGEFGEGDGLTGEALEQRVFEGLGALAFSDLLPPGLKDGVYEALGRVPGIELLENTEDIAGRAALGMARTDTGTGARSAYLFAPETFHYLGFQKVQVEERDGVEAGTVLDEYALLELGVVDERKQRPGQGDGTA
ncbi:CU044_5270 family protein [Streptomyces profundus]|uniref:CU044_5270 family protein n=1 Tax=Streptomyces profundus TaxID=2867410 RepID=UPI001D16D213|nr:CU044_5270 family protein [Streptomyces sp. MA3_2.13]UED84378.1 CU044_5270 family protein [Streptomyces sp. MA3_2.13]